jgi:catechol 2,3-dioxygenase-like lactoylglutathione lyase family enzyme
MVRGQVRSAWSLPSPERRSRRRRRARISCFLAHDRAAVRAFHAAALAAGGRDDGPPGLRAHDHADYYGTFVLDPDGHRIAAVCHAPQAPMVIA